MITPDLIIGIDPGKSGGGISSFRDGVVKTVRMPVEAKDMQDYFKYLKTVGTNPLVFIEKLQYRASDRNIPGKDYQIAKMLSHYERLCTTMQLTGLPFIEVHPVTWQTYLHLKVKEREEKDDRKRRYRDIAQEFYKQTKVTLWNCDAIMLMHFGRKKLKFNMDWIIDHLPEHYKQESRLLM